MSKKKVYILTQYLIEDETLCGIEVFLDYDKAVTMKDKWEIAIEDEDCYCNILEAYINE